MIPFYKNELRYISLRIFPLLILVGLVWYCHRPVSDTGFDNKAMTPQEFHASRQTLWVNSDSLAIILTKIKEKESDAFSVESDGTEWIAVANDKKTFERIFLDAEPLSNWNTNEQNSIVKLKKGYGFTAKMKTIDGKPYVQLPAEIIQSIQLAE